MKKILNISIILISLLFFTNVVFALDDSDGDGFLEIKTCSDLDEIDTGLTRDYELMNNLVCTFGRLPIGDRDTFTGNFKGNNYFISDLFISSDSSCVGLFANTNGSIISDLYLINLQIDGNSQSGKIGGLIGCADDTDILNVSITGTINCEGTGYSCGGIVGHQTTGGLLQTRFIGNIESDGNISSYAFLGGLIGDLDSVPETFVITESYFEGDITSVGGQDQIGGLIGTVGGGNLDIKDSYVNANLETTTGIVGGLANADNATISINNCYSTGNIDSEWMTAGIIYSGANSAVNHSFTTMDFLGNDTMNGIIYMLILPNPLENNWWYNTNADQNYSDINVTGINKANAFSDFYDSDFNVYTGISNPWNFTSVWLDGSSYPILRWAEDADNDGIPDKFDNMSSNLENVDTTGITNLIMTIDGMSNSYSGNGVQEVAFYDGGIKLFDFNYDFSLGVLDLSQIKIMRNSKYLLVNLGGQLQENYTKTMYLTNSSFITLCLEDAEITALSQMSESCSDTNEYNILACLNGNQTIGEIVCNYNSTSKLITITGLTNSAIRGTVRSTGGGGGGGSDDDDVPDTNTPDTNTPDTNTPDTNITQPIIPVYVDIINIETEDKPFIEQPVVVDLNTDTNTTTDITEPSLVDKAIAFVTSKVFLYIAIGLIAFIIFVIVVVVISKRKSRKPKEEPKAKPKEEPKKELPKSILVQIRKPETQKPKEEPKAKSKEEPKSKSKRSEDLSIDDYLKKQDELKIADFLKRDSKK